MRFASLLVVVNNIIGLSLSFTVIMGDSSTLPGPAKTARTEQEAVYDIMKATGNDWATHIPDVCRGRWHGIECMPDKNNVFHVVSLSFGALSEDTAFPTCDPTRSTISPAITHLPHLRALFFYRCFSSGNPQPIPPFLGQLGSSLRTLVLRENGHVGPIPFHLANLTRLTVLDLHGNNLNGSIPVSLARITGLRVLDLGCNRLSGPIPNIHFPSLRVLDLNQNHLKDSISMPIPLLSSTRLIKIDVSRNRISGPIPALKGLTDLALLDLSYNTLTGPFPDSFSDLESLQVLNLNGNPTISSVIPNTFFKQLNSLMIIGLSNTNLQGSIPNSLGELTTLRVLHLDGNQLNGTIPPSFANLNGLSELRLDNNKLMGPIPFKRDRVWKMGRKLRLSNNLGLCYETKSGLGDDLDTLSSAGIGHCEATEIGPTVSVQHISKSKDMLKYSTKSSASIDTKITRVFGLSLILLIVSCLL